MELIIFPKKGGSPVCVGCDRWYHIALPAVLLGVSIALAAGYGYQLGSSAHNDRPALDGWEDDLAGQRHEIQVLRESARADINALSQQVAGLQARIIRLDALGQRLVKLADLDDKEFDFDSAPGVGGPHAPTSGAVSGDEDFKRYLGTLARRLEEREAQLRALDEILLSRNLRDALRPAGRPVAKGWVSSPYGKRADPFTGEPEFHKGVDIAGKEGTDVVAVGGGIVTWAGRRSGYGRFVEIDHGGGLLTRYGHNKALLVKVGDVVKRGQVIARLGNSGRSTGPHIHFEVVKNGRHVDPAPYLRGGRQVRRRNTPGRPRS